MRLEAMAVRLPHVEGHPNRVGFEGVLTVVNTPSDKAPAGARGHRVILTREAAEKALPSLLGMAVDYRPGWDGHDARCKIGLLTEANLVGNRLVVRGYLGISLFGKDQTWYRLPDADYAQLDPSVKAAHPMPGHPAGAPHPAPHSAAGAAPGH